MDEDKDLNNFLNAIGIHAVAPVAIEPDSLMRNWHMYEVHWDEGKPTRHLVGTVHEGRVTSAIVKMDPVNMLFESESGRVYRLAGPSRYSDDAEYVWGRWQKLAGARNPRDITRALLRLRRILERKL